MAAGLKMETARLEDFRRAFSEYALGAVTPEMMMPQLTTDCEAELGQITPALVNDLNRLGPFGHRNPKPLLWIRQAAVAAPPRRVGKTGEHLQLTVKQGQQSLRCIAFKFSELADRLSPGTVVDLAVAPMLNEYNGRVNVELDVKDLKTGGDS